MKRFYSEYCRLALNAMREGHLFTARAWLEMYEADAALERARNYNEGVAEAEAKFNEVEADLYAVL